MNTTSNTPSIDAREVLIMKNPPKPQWTLTLTEDKEFQLHLPTAPNKFHRLMQKIILGFRWDKIKELNKEQTDE